MSTSHIPTHSPSREQRYSDTAVDITGDTDPMERALEELTRAGIGFEIVSEHNAWERAA